MELRVDGDKRRTIKAGMPLTLSAFAKDPDNIPERRGRGVSPTPTVTPAALYRAPSSLVPASGPGLRLSWIVYRGRAADVTFTPEQMKAWTDTRAYANSMWSRSASIRRRRNPNRSLPKSRLVTGRVM